MLKIRHAALAAVALLALSACQKPTVDLAAVTEEAKQSANDWAAAYNAGDADAIAAMYAEDAVLMPPNAPAAAGRSAIRDFLATDSANAKAAGMKLAITSTDVGANGDLSWHSGTFTVTDANGATVDTGKYVEVRHRMEGKSMIIRDIWNSDMPLPAPAPAAEAAPAT
jgi:ketosteroid isomerase-like protein